VLVCGCYCRSLLLQHILLPTCRTHRRKRDKRPRSSSCRHRNALPAVRRSSLRLQRCYVQLLLMLLMLLLLL
jgi:hypothetical protein